MHVEDHDQAKNICQILPGGVVRGRVPAPAPQGRAVQVDPIKPFLKPPGTKHLKLKC